MSQKSHRQFDIAIVGAGIAGASVAYELATDARVVVIEMESHPGYHTTGRSAAVFSEFYGPAPIRALTSQSRAFYENSPEVFGQYPLLTPRGVLYAAREDQMNSLEALRCRLSGGAGLRMLDEDEIRRMSPLLRPGYAAAGLYEEQASDIDVNALHLGYLRGLRQRGGEVVVGSEVKAAERKNGAWVLSTCNDTIVAPVVVNAAGAWADELASIMGADPAGLVPKRRTALLIAAPEDADPSNWAVTVDVDEQFYLKPDAGRLLISPADETPSAPCDAQPEEMDIAICIDRIQRAFSVDVKRVENCWAGLRTFVEDHAPVCGYDPSVEGLFWLAGQGGYGIQSAPGLSQLAARLVTGRPVPEDLEQRGFRATDVSPLRLRRRPEPVDR